MSLLLLFAGASLQAPLVLTPNPLYVAVVPGENRTAVVANDHRAAIVPGENRIAIVGR